MIVTPSRARVSTAARELGYVVDRHASSLRLKSSETLALVTICRPGEDRSAINPFYFALLGSIAEAVGPDVVHELRVHGPSAPSWSRGPRRTSDGRGPRDTYG